MQIRRCRKRSDTLGGVPPGAPLRLERCLTSIEMAPTSFGMGLGEKRNDADGSARQQVRIVRIQGLPRLARCHSNPGNIDVARRPLGVVIGTTLSVLASK